MIFVPRGLALTWLQLFAMAGGHVTAMAWGTAGFYLREDTDGARSEKPEKPREPIERLRWEWGHFLCKEIKVKRKIKVWFPASWFVFGTEIPFFLSEIAETTIAPLPVLVTMTPLTSSLGHVRHEQVNLQLHCGFVLTYSAIQREPDVTQWDFYENGKKFCICFPSPLIFFSTLMLKSCF